MGFLDTLLGRTKPVAPNLDVLFQLPSAARAATVAAPMPRAAPVTSATR